MGPWWLELPIARTHFDSPFEFEPAKFYCSNKACIIAIISLKTNLFWKVQDQTLTYCLSVEASSMKEIEQRLAKTEIRKIYTDPIPSTCINVDC